MSDISEIAVLGSCLVSSEAVTYSLANLSPEFFKDPRHATIFKQIQALQKEKIDIDVVTLTETMSADFLARAGGRSYLISVMEQVPTAAHVEHYVGLLRRDYFETELKKAFEAAAESPSDPEHREALKRLWDRLEQKQGRLIDLGEGLMKYMESIQRRSEGNVSSVFTGYTNFDNLTASKGSGQLITIGARTSRGKTTFLLCLADRFIMRDRPVLFYSAEMGHTELVDRMMSARTKIPLQRIRTKLLESDFPKLTQAAQEIYKKPLLVNDSGRLSLAQIRSDIEKTKPQIVMVDYIQRFAVPGDANRAAFFSDVANELKSIAREYDVLVFATSQLSRRVEESGKEREPSLADLKESGGIEEASDIVVLLHSKIGSDGTPEKEFSFIIAKNRNGPLGRVQFLFFKNTVSFEEIADDSDFIGQ